MRFLEEYYNKLQPSEQEFIKFVVDIHQDSFSEHSDQHFHFDYRDEGDRPICNNLYILKNKLPKNGFYFKMVNILLENFRSPIYDLRVEEICHHCRKFRKG